MHVTHLPRIGTADAWRAAARCYLAADVRPDDIHWRWGEQPKDLFSQDKPLPPQTRDIMVPKAFIDMANRVVWHSDPERFARLYAFLVRVQTNKGLMSDRGEPALAKLRMMEKAVSRCSHKMKAFVRFRDLASTGPRRAFAAWFEPTHHTVEPTASFFARRFGDMDWVIVTPDITARFENGDLTFEPGRAKPDLPDDAAEELWGTYFCNIFNPARLKVQAMTSEMPKKYWKNMPEARHIPHLIATAEARVQAMRDAAPTLPPARMAAIRKQLTQEAQPASWNMLDAGLRGCARCPIGCNATQVVAGHGKRNARLMIVGEQPGEVEDRIGLPFVGPAGQLFDKLATSAGLDCNSAYVTNAVKHFKFNPRGKRRIHQSPNTSEIEACKFWLQTEIDLIQPKLIVALGGTAAESLTGSRKNLLARRGTIEKTPFGPVFITVHPSFLLRLPAAEQPAAQDAFVDDLKAVLALQAS